MSLFKILPWFNYQSPDSELNYDSYSLTCARLNSDNEHQKDNIVISSHSGMITILQPCIYDAENPEQQQHQQSCIVYESKLDDPILGVLCGNFIQYTSQRSERQNMNVAILHPRKLVIYSLVTSTGFAEHGQQSKLQILQQYELQKSAFTFCQGSFGGVKGKEFICVMFLDSSLKFFEQDGICQDCVLPGNRSIPTNFVYIPRTDCFLLLAPNWDLECYRYLSLSESYERKFSPIWSQNVGEYILDLNCHQISNTESLIVLLGENNLICVSDTGKTRFIKKLDYTPISFFTFTVGWYFEPDCKLMIAIATENGSLLIYQNSTLVWCAELLEETISIRRGNFMGLNGGLVTLNPSGKVTVGFLGSDPNIFKVPPINLSKLDYEKSKFELEEMEKEINSSVDNSDVPFINAAAEKDLQVKSHLQFENVNEGEFCKLHIKLLVTVNLEQVQVCITENPAFVVPENVFFLKDLKANDKHSFEATVFRSEEQVSELFEASIQIMISFVNKQSIARVIKHTVDVPLNQVASVSSPQKDGLFKVTLTITHPIDLAQIFSDLKVSEVGQAIGFNTLNSDSITTLITAKSSNKYRLQSNSLAALGLILSVFAQRTLPPEGAKASSRSVYVKAIPQSTVEFLLTTIEKHHNMKSEMRGIIDALNSKTIEMRLFERCFLVKMQSKAPAHSMEGINLLLRTTYEEILALVSEYKTLKTHISRIQTQLTSTIFFVRKVIEYADLPQQKITDNLLSIIRPASDFDEQSWMQSVAPYVDYLYSMYQTKANQNQFYENFSFRNDNFSLSRFNKQLKHILSVIVDCSTDTMRNVENILAEEPELKDSESEWSSSGAQINPAFDNKL